MTTHSHTATSTLLTVKDLSIQTGMSMSTIYRKRSNGESLPRVVKIGSALRWRQADVDAWVEEQLEPAAS